MVLVVVVDFVVVAGNSVVVVVDLVGKVRGLPGVEISYPIFSVVEAGVCVVFLVVVPAFVVVVVSVVVDLVVAVVC